MELGNSIENRLFTVDSQKKYFATADDIDPQAENNSLSHIIKAITNNSIVLDVGCSYGYLGEWLIKNKKCKVYGIDISNEALEYVKERGYYEDTFNLDLDYPQNTKEEFERFNQIDEMFDFIVCADVLEHLKDPTTALEFVARKLKFGGQVIVSIPNIAHMDIVLNLLESRFNYSEFGILDNTHLRFFTKRSFAEWIKNANQRYKTKDFQFDVKHIGYTTYVSEFQKKFKTNYTDLYNQILNTNPELEILQHIFVLTKINTFANPYNLNELLNNNPYQNALSEIQTQIETFNSQITNNHKIIGELKTNLNERDKHIENLSNKLSNLQKTINESQLQLNKKNEEIIKLLKDNLSFKETINGLETDLDNKTKHINNLEGELLSLRSSIQTLEAEKQQYSNQLAEIFKSRGYKMVLKYYKIRDKLLPVGSKRRKIVKFIGKDIYLLSKKSIQHIRQYGFKSFLYKLAKKTKIDDPYSLWIKKNEPNNDELKKQKNFRFNLEPKISIIVPTWNTPKQFLIDMIESVLKQTYPNWELCIADGASKEDHVKKVLAHYVKKDNRIKVKYLSENKGIAGNSNEAISISSGDYIALLDHDDTLAPFALFEVVKAINENEEADFIYSDEDKLSEDGTKRLDPHFKPDFSPDTLRSYNYITHLSVIKKELLDEVGWFKRNDINSLNYDGDIKNTIKQFLRDSQSLILVQLTYRMCNGYGVDLVVAEQTKYFLSKGYIVIIICFEYEESYLKDKFLGYIDSPNLLIYKVNSLENAINKLCNIKADILIAHTPPLFSVFKNIKTNVLKVFFDYGEPPPHLFPDKKDRELINKEKYDAAKYADLCISISNYIKQESGIEHSFVLFNGNDHLLSKQGAKQSFRATYGLENYFIVLNITRFFKAERNYKGVDLYAMLQERLFKKYPELKSKVVFVLAGRGDEEDATWCSQNGLFVCQNIPDDILINAYKESNLYLSMSQWEGYNLGIAQALAFGLDVIASDKGAHSEFGIFVSNDIDKLVDYIAKSYKKQLISGNYNKKNLLFPWRDNVAKLEELILKSLWEKFTSETILLSYRNVEQNIIAKVYNDASDYDLMLRCTEKAKNIVHIPKILYHFRISPANYYNYNPITRFSKTAIQDHLDRLGLRWNTVSNLHNIFNKINYKINYDYKISIIIPNKDHKEELEICIDSILTKTTYKNYEIIIVENNSTQETTFKYYEYIKNKYNNIFILEWKDIFNYSAINNFAVKYAKGDILLFLNNDTEVINENWLEEMIQYVQRKDVGVVGAKLYYPDDTIQHGGVILGIGGMAGHSHRFFSKNSHGYFGRLVIVQNLSAVTGACLMIRKEIFNEVGGFDEEYPLAVSDVDICLKVGEKGYLVVWTPYAELYHHESKTRGFDDTPEKQERFKKEIELFKKKWNILEKGDPYYNPNLTLNREDFGIKEV